MDEKLSATPSETEKSENVNQSSITRLCSELSLAGIDLKQLEMLEHLETRRITPDKNLPPMEFLFRLYGKPCFPRGELVGLTGRPKSGKTFVSSILMTLCFRQEVLTIRRETSEQLRVLWYDTEQSDESTQDILRNRIMPMLGSPESVEDMHLFESAAESAFQIFNVRQDMWQERMPLLEAAIKRYHPDLVIVDGIRDLINDINDGVLAQDTVERLMHLASSLFCCIVCILHQNKAAEDKNLRGWIGTELTHKAFEVYECEKSEDRIFSLTQKLTRKYDILDALKYVVDENGIPQLASIEHVIESEHRQKVIDNGGRPELNKKYFIGWEDNKPRLRVSALFIDALPKEGVLYIAKDMQEKVMKMANITSPYYYNKIREQALAENVIVKSTTTDGYVAYYRPETSLFGDAIGDAPF